MERKSNLPSNLLYEVCSVILDTGYLGSPDEYVQEYYHKPKVCELTIAEAELIIKTLKDKPGCLFQDEQRLVVPAQDHIKGTFETYMEEHVNQK